jgi:hypothetical protein
MAVRLEQVLLFRLFLPTEEVEVEEGVVVSAIYLS